MAVFNGAFPVLPGKANQARAFAREISGHRRRDFNESQARFGATRETWTLQSTPGGDFMIVWFEAPDIEKVFTTLGESSDPFDVWFRQQALEVCGVDLSAPSEEPLPEVLVDWTKWAMSS
jgi:hypothetical protein